MKQNNQNSKPTPRFLAPKRTASVKQVFASRPWLTVLCTVAVALLLLDSVLLLVLPSQQVSAAEAIAATTEPTLPPETEPPETEAPPETEPPETEAPPETEPPYEPDEELLDAMERNPDIIGRLSFGDGNRSFVPYGTDNSYYLSRDAFGTPDRNGSTFLDYRCTLEPRDTNLLIHGHNWDISNSGNGKAFAPLHKFKNKSFMAEHPIFTFETATDVQYYVPYALATAETKSWMPGYYRIIQWNFATDADFEAYVGYMTRNSLIEMPVTAEPGDKLLTLSTCFFDGNNDTEIRLLMCLRQLREGETVAQMQALYRTGIDTGSALKHD